MSRPRVWNDVHVPPPGSAMPPAGRFRAAVPDLPLPGAGRTGERFDRLAAVAADDLALARLTEGHADALAILAELGAPDPPNDQRWAVWAAEATPVTARPTPDGWRLTGRKSWCSGAAICSHALVTGAAPDGGRLFALELTADGVRPGSGTWQGLGMRGAGTEHVDLDDVPATPVGGPGDYLGRSGFWHGAAGVAACWYGGARGVARPLHAAARRPAGLHPHALAHLGGVEAALVGARAALSAAAADIDADPGDAASRAQRRALAVRAVVEAAATDVLDRVGRALGPGPLALDGAHAQRVADLQVYLRQSHAERDLATLGALLAADEQPW